MAVMQDSIYSKDNAHVPSGDSVAHDFSPRHPYQVLRMLPADATPEQQDSAIQANFQPAEIHYSQCPDTLHLPGHKITATKGWKDIPMYYKETFFSKDTMFQSEYKGTLNGVPGVAVPYSMRTDPFVTIVLLAFIFITAQTISRMRRFISNMFKSIPHTSHHTVDKETSSEIYAQVIFNIMGAMLTAFFMFSCVQHFISDTYVVATQYHLMGIFLMMIIGYKLFKLACYNGINNVFWDNKHNLQYIRFKLFTGALEGVLLLIVIMTQIYFELSMPYTVVCFVFVQIVIKLLTIYKCNVIFFNQRGVFLHFFLYLCALEIAPAAVLWTAIVMTANILKVNL